MSRPLLYLVTWIVGVLTIILGLGSLNWPALSRLSARGVATQGVVLALHPQEHATVEYEYAVGGQTYRGRRAPGPPNRPLDQLSVGQTLTVTYDPQRSASSFPGDPRPALQNETISVGLAAAVMPLLIVLAVARALHRRQSAAAAPQVA